MDLERTERSTGKTRAYEPTPAADDLRKRCQNLVIDLSAFQSFAAARKCKTVDIAKFKTSVQAEETVLAKLSQADQTDSDTVHNLRSSNLPFYEAVWDAAKSSSRLLGLQKRFYWQKKAPKKNNKGKQKKRSALVDIVAEDGQLWIKISTVTQSKLLFEKAKVGWEADEFNGSSDDGQMGRKILPQGAEPIQEPEEDSEGEDEGLMELVRVARDLSKASLATRVQFKHPHALILLPNIDEGSNEVVDSILADVRRAGVEVRCGGLSSNLHESNTSSAAYEHMLPVFRPTMTDIVNLDCTVLLALISDLSHGDVEKLILPERPHPSLSYQVDIERATPLLPRILWPGLRNANKLVASARSAARMWDIVKIIGTPAEHERARLLFGLPSGEDQTGSQEQQDAETLRNKLAELSVHDVPALPLPIIVVEDGINTASAIPANILGRVSGQLSDINRSVFLLGWTNGWTTVTSNQVAVKTIENTITDELNRIQSDRADPEFEGPILWTIDVARSLVGKESGRAQ